MTKGARLGFVAGAFGAMAVVAYQIPGRIVLRVGSPSDAPFVEGFWSRDDTQGFPFRWSSGEATIRLPGVAWHADRKLVVRAAPGNRPSDAPAPTLKVLVNEREVAVLHLDPVFRNYEIPVPADVLKATGELAVTLRATTFERDGRDLGVVVEKVRLEGGEGSGMPLPPIPLIVEYGLTGLLSAALLLLGRGAGRSRLLLLVLAGEAGALAAAGAEAPEWTALAAPYLVGLLALAYLAACQARSARGVAGTSALGVLHTLGIESRAWRGVAAGAVVVFAGFQFVMAFLPLVRTWGPKDVRIYRGAGALWLEGGDYYDVPAFRARFGDDTPEKTGFAFTNPPTGAMLYAPLALLTVDRAAALWRLVSVAFLVVAGLLLWAWGRGQTDRPPSPAWLALLLCFSRPTWTTLELGQVGTLVLLLLAGSLWAFARGRRRLCGAALGLAGLVKVLPGFPIVLFLARRDWRAVGGAAAVSVGGLAVALGWRGVAPWLTFVHRVLPALSAQTSHILNQSPQAFLSRMWGGSPMERARFNFTFETPSSGHAAPHMLAVAFGLAALALTAWWMRRHDDGSRPRRSLELATMVPVMLLVAPLVWAFYLAWLLVPIYVLLVLLAFRPLSGTVQGAVLGCLGAAWLLMQVDTSVVYRIEGWPVPLMSLGLYATLLVFAASLVVLGKMSPRDAGAPS
jgi:alpha-1,2-mannosyltransferase